MRKLNVLRVLPLRPFRIVARRWQRFRGQGCDRLYTRLGKYRGPIRLRIADCRFLTPCAAQQFQKYRLRLVHFILPLKNSPPLTAYLCVSAVSSKQFCNTYLYFRFR